MAVRDESADQKTAVANPAPLHSPSSWQRTTQTLEAPFRWARLTGPQRSTARRVAFALLVFAISAWLVSRQAYAWHHLLAGKRSLAADHSREALQHFQAALHVWPRDGSTHLLAARAAWKAGSFQAADLHLQECQALPAFADQAQFERVLLRASQGEVDAVGGVCQAMLRNDHPETPLILEALTVGNLTLLRFGAAATLLDEWLEKSPDQPQATFLYGRLQLQASNNQESLTLLRRAVDLDPARSDARVLLAGLHLDLGQAQEALPHLEEVCRREPQNMAAKARLAQGLVLLGRPEEAAAHLDDVLQQRPDLTLALLERGKLALREGELDQAEQWLQTACKRGPGDRTAHYQLLQCLKQLGKEAEARVIQKRLDQLDQDASRMHVIVTEELPQRRFDPELQAELGQLLLNVGVVDDGLTWLNRALQIDPRQARAHRALADYYESLGQSAKAQPHRALAGPAEDASVGKEYSQGGD